MREKGWGEGEVVGEGGREGGVRERGGGGRWDEIFFTLFLSY